MESDEPIQQREMTGEDIRNFDRFIGLSAATGGRHAFSFFIDLYARTMLLHNLNPQPVIREIKAMEGQIPPTGTKPPTQFKGPWLGGLWHKHFEDTNLASMAINLKNGWKDQGMELFKQRIADAENGTAPKFFTIDDVPAMVDDLVSGTYRRRKAAQKLTGEWIVYAIHEGKNYYLGLWQHSNGDEMLRQNIERNCLTQFPFLKDILTPLPV